jgi:hypothetical protein
MRRLRHFILTPATWISASVFAVVVVAWMVSFFTMPNWTFGDYRRTGSTQVNVQGSAFMAFLETAPQFVPTSVPPSSTKFIDFETPLFSQWAWDEVRDTRNGREHEVQRIIKIPLWPIALVTGVLPTLRFQRYRRERRAWLGGHCAHCGYDLRASPERCPECGTTARGKLV